MGIKAPEYLWKKELNSMRFRLWCSYAVIIGFLIMEAVRWAG